MSKITRLLSTYVRNISTKSVKNSTKLSLKNSKLPVRPTSTTIVHKFRTCRAREEPADLTVDGPEDPRPAARKRSSRRQLSTEKALERCEIFTNPRRAKDTQRERGKLISLEMSDQLNCDQITDDGYHVAPLRCKQNQKYATNAYA